MVKKIKLPLEMANGVTVRTIEELKENWDLEKIVFYYNNGRLLTWLNDRYYSEQAQQLKMLVTITDAHELQKQLCSIFDMPFVEEESVDVEAVAVKNEKLAKLRKLTSDDEILKNAEKAAFNQEELAELLDEDVPVIYLANNTFTIPVTVKNKKYVGVGAVTAVINSKKPIDFDALGIIFKNIKFDDNYSNLFDPAKLYLFGLEAFKQKNYSEAYKLFKRSSEMGNADAMYQLGLCYNRGVGTDFDYKQAFAWVKRAAEAGNLQAMATLGDLYCEGTGIDQNFTEAIKSYKIAVKGGIDGIDFKLGNAILLQHESNWNEALPWIRKAAENDDVEAQFKLSQYYEVKKDEKEAVKWCLLAAENGDADAQWQLGHYLLNGQGIAKDYDKAYQWLEKSVKNGNKYTSEDIKKIKNKVGILLQMPNGIKVRTIEELKANWDQRSVVEFYKNGELTAWLDSHYYSDEAVKLHGLDSIKNVFNMEQKLCSVFEMPFSEKDTTDKEMANKRKKIVDKLRSKSIEIDDKLLKSLDTVVFNQLELKQLLDDLQYDTSTIYLVDNTFEIPLKVRNKNFIGLGFSIAVIKSEKPVDFTQYGVTFVNVLFDDKYHKLTRPIKLFNYGKNFYDQKNYSEALRWFKISAEKGNADAQDMLGEMYANKGRGVPVDFAEAIKWYQRAAEQGHSRGLFHLGQMHEYGLGVKEDFYKAAKWYKKAADKGNIKALENLGYLYKKGGNGLQRDYRKAANWYEKAANKGSVEAQVDLGHLYHDGGYGLEPNIRMAVQWYRKAAEQGDVDAQTLTGSLLMQIKEIQNLDEGLKWIGKACEQGSAYALVNMGLFYQNGIGVRQSYESAISYFKKAIEQDNKLGYYYLACLYRDGDGVKQDKEEAKRLFSKSAKLGYKKAEEALKELEGGCFITTAVCGSLNKTDDCDELMSMRRLRDKLKVEDSDMSALIEEYYRIAPLIVKKIDSATDAPTVYRWLWDNSISKICEDIMQENYRDAKLRYISMLEDLCVRYDEPLAHGINGKIERVRMKKN